MSGNGIKAANVTVLAVEGRIPPAADAAWPVFHGGRRFGIRMALRRRDVLAIPHANENRPGAPTPSSANGLSAVRPFAERPPR